MFLHIVICFKEHPSVRSVFSVVHMYIYRSFQLHVYCVVCTDVNAWTWPNLRSCDVYNTECTDSYILYCAWTCNTRSGKRMCNISITLLLLLLSPSLALSLPLPLSLALAHSPICDCNKLAAEHWCAYNIDCKVYERDSIKLVRRNDVVGGGDITSTTVDSPIRDCIASHRPYDRLNRCKL